MMTSSRVVFCLVVLAAQPWLISFVSSTETTEQIKETADAAWEKMKDSFSNAGDYMNGKIKSLENIYGDTKETLSEKVDSTVNFLSAVKDNQKEMLMHAKEKGNTKLQEALANVESMLKEAQTYQKNLREDASAKFGDTSAQWKTKASELWNSGLQSITEWASTIKRKAIDIKEDL